MLVGGTGAAEFPSVGIISWSPSQKGKASFEINLLSVVKKRDAVRDHS
jgi:hypothetical protein